MNSDVLVKAEGVSKKFCRDLKRSLWYGLKDISSEILGITPSEELRKKEFWAVNDVSFELRRGECLGLIGHNGAGKSTLLKMLNGLIKPDKGRITMKGRIGALIELGAGFNPILTGRENIYNNGAVLGFSKKEIDSKMDAIIDFAEIEEFIDSPVQNYSSGMKVRLGFAVAAQMEPDVLLVDEVLAVGDVGFKNKCYNRIQELLKNATVIFVSHSMTQVAKICNTGLLLTKGEIETKSDEISTVIDKYYGNFDSSGPISVVDSGKVALLKSEIASDDDRIVGDTKELISNNLSNKYFYYGESFIMRLLLQSRLVHTPIDINISIYDSEARLVSQCSTINSEGNKMLFEEFSTYQVKVVVPNLYLNKGNYSISIVVLSKSTNSLRGETLLLVDNLMRFQVSSKNIVHGAAPYLLDSKWHVEKKEEGA